MNFPCSTDARVGVYYMANATDVTPRIADAAIALLRGEPYPAPERQAIKVDPKTLDRYVGRYYVGSDVFDVTQEDGSLFVQKNNNGKGEFLAETSTEFFIKGDPATVTFEQNAAGEVKRMLIFEADWQFKIGEKQD